LFAYSGRVLRVDLATGKAETEALNETLVKQYIGGIGLGIQLLMHNSKAGTEPFSPDNPLIFATGPLSGTMGPTAGNGYAVVSKSPATGGVAESKAHGFFGPELKRAG
jgi:aldehyde:ferredoxin oxidoreductase